MAVGSVGGSSYYSSPLRMTGMSSGMDTDALVRALTINQQSKIDKVFQNKTKLEWKQSSYSGVNAAMNKMRNEFLSVMNSGKNMLAASTFQSKTTTYTQNPFFKVTAGSTAAMGNYSISDVKMASTASIKGSALNTKAAELVGALSYNKTIVSGKLDAAFDENSTLEQIMGNDSPVKITINGENFEFDASKKLSEVMSEVNASAASVNMTFDAATNKVSIESLKAGPSATVAYTNVSNKFFGTGLTAMETKQENVLLSDSLTLEQMADLRGASGTMFDSNGKLSFSINGKTFNFDKSDTLSTVLSTVSSDPTANATITFNATKGQFVLRSKETGTMTELKVSNVSGKFFGKDGLMGISEGTTDSYSTIGRGDTIADIERKTGMSLSTGLSIKLGSQPAFTMSGDKTLGELMDEINKSDLGVTLSYSSISDSFVLTTKKSGKASGIDLDTTQTTMGFFGFEGTPDAGGKISVTGTDASVKIGSDVYESRNNTFTVDGLTFEITGTMAATDAAINFSVSQNTDSVVDKVKEFVTEYNKLVESLNSQFVERSNRKYAPLTDEQREAMTEKQIEQWDAEAKKGLLYKDPYINSFVETMRRALTTKVGATGLSPMDIGIKPSYSLSSPNGGTGMIELDEKKLREALEKDSDAVAKVFTDSSYSTDKPTKFNESGFSARLNDALSNFSSAVRSNQTLPNAEQIAKLNTQMENMKYNLYLKSEKLYMKYAQMESMLGSMGSQQNWLGSALGSLGK